MTGEQKENNFLWSEGVAKSIKLDMYGEFMTIINVSKDYNIPHDEVYNMSVNAVYTLVDITKRTEYGQSRMQEIKRTLSQ